MPWLKDTRLKAAPNARFRKRMATTICSAYHESYDRGEGERERYKAIEIEGEKDRERGRDEVAFKTKILM